MAEYYMIARNDYIIPTLSKYAPIHQAICSVCELYNALMQSYNSRTAPGCYL
jgi:hypothetical protein